MTVSDTGLLIFDNSKPEFNGPHTLRVSIPGIFAKRLDAGRSRVILNSLRNSAKCFLGEKNVYQGLSCCRKVATSSEQAFACSVFGAEKPSIMEQHYRFCGGGEHYSIFHGVPIPWDGKFLLLPGGFDKNLLDPGGWRL